MLLLKEALFFLLAYLDMTFTEEKIQHYGVEVELNPAVRKMIYFFARFMRPQWAIGWGTFLGIAVPTVAIMALGWKWPDILMFTLGARFCLFLFQQQMRNYRAKSDNDSNPSG